MKINESNLEFDFHKGLQPVKFDGTNFYRQRFNKFPGAKGVDFLAVAPSTFLMIEVKNCKGHEGVNRWRIANDNKKRDRAAGASDVSDRDSLDIEMAQKTAQTLACLMGANTCYSSNNVEELQVFYDALSRMKEVPLKLVLFLEGDFKSSSRSKKMIMNSIAESIRKKLSWLNCLVTVEDSHTQSKRYYEVM